MEQKRYTIDCRNHPAAAQSGCTLSFSGTEQEVLETGVLHGKTRHGYQDTPEFRAELKKMMKEEKEIKVA